MATAFLLNKITARPAFVGCVGLRCAVALLLAAAMLWMPFIGRGQDEAAPRSEFGLRLGDLASESWGGDDGLPSDEVFDLLQTRDGYLWVATAGGLARFDGIRFEVFDRANTPGLKSDKILTLYESRDGTLWAGSEGGGLTAFHPGRQRRAEPIEELAELTVRALMEDRDGVLWAATSAGAWRSRGQGQGQGSSFERVEVGLREVTTMAEDAGGTLWLGGPEGLVRRKGDAFERPEYAQGIDAVQVIAVGDDDTLWLGTGRGLIHVRKEGVERFYRNSSIMLLDRDPLGILWYASGGGALSRIHEGLPEPARWSGAGVTCILRDREGSLWLGGRGEPQVLRQLKPAAPASIDNPSVCVLPSETGGVWLGSNRGVAWLPVGMAWRAVSDDRFVIREATYALARGSEGSIWAGHRNGTISRWSKDGLETFLEPRRYSVASIHTIYEDHAGTLWIGYRNKGAARLEAKTGTLVPLPEFDELNVRWFQEMPGGEFFIGTSDGLFQDGARVSDPLLEGLADADFFAHHLDDDGNLWLTILGNGLCRWKDGRFSTWRRKVGFLKDNLLTVMTDNDGNLWIGTRRGVFYLAKRSLEDLDAGKIGKIEEIEYKSVAEGRGEVKRAGGYPLAAHALDGSLWIVRQQDVLYLPPGVTLTNPHEPPVLVEHVFADGTALEGGDAVEFRSGTRRLTIHYTSPTHMAPESAKFKYRLSGHTDDWIEVGAERVAQFTDLPPGKYGFQVIASNGHGVWNETGATIAIQVLPRWFERWWIRVGSFIGALILLGAFVRMRLAAANRRNEALQREVFERTHAEEQLKEQAARLALATSATRIASWDWDIVTNEVHFSPEWKKQLGYEDDELNNVFEEWESRLHPEDRERTLKAFEDYISGEAPEYALEFRLRHRDGSYRWIYTRADKELDDEGKALRVFGCHVDISERREALRALEQSEERYRALFEGSQNGIVYADSKTRQFKYANPSAGRMLGYTAEELCQLSVEDIHPEWAREEVAREFEAQLKGESRMAQGLPCLRKDGTVIYADVSGGKFKTSEGEFSIGFFTDITERKEAEEQVQDYQQQLKELTSQLTIAEERERRRIALELHDEVGQNLALARIQLASARNAEDGAPLSAKLEELSETILKATRDTRHLVYDLSSPSLNELGLGEAIGEWLEVEIGSRQGLEVEFSTDGADCPLNEDVSALLFRSIRELLTNVVKHGKATRVSVEMKKCGDEMQITIQDDGVGFDPDTKAFHPGIDGGFGLFSIRERMRNMGGEIKIESEKGKGCRVILSLSCSQKSVK